MKDYIFKEIVNLPSSKESMGKIEPILMQVQTIADIPEDRFYNLLISVTEAVNNAIMHGNGFDSSKTVTVTLTATEDYVEIEVQDEGSGFDPDMVADPREPENLLKASGRGIFIIKSLIEQVSFENNEIGTKVSMKFTI
jgi:serine/threonine-protein kinase RsbW